MGGDVGGMKLPGSPMYWTYFMVKWDETRQTPSDQKCVQCGGKMNSVEPVTDSKGSKYEGTVCHNCRRVLWVRAR